MISHQSLYPAERGDGVAALTSPAVTSRRPGQRRGLVPSVKGADVICLPSRQGVRGRRSTWRRLHNEGGKQAADEGKQASLQLREEGGVDRQKTALGSLVFGC